jgi:hypothetical protein
MKEKVLLGLLVATMVSSCVQINAMQGFKGESKSRKKSSGSGHKKRRGSDIKRKMEDMRKQSLKVALKADDPNPFHTTIIQDAVIAEKSVSEVKKLINTIANDPEFKRLFFGLKKEERIKLILDCKDKIGNTALHYCLINETDNNALMYDLFLQFLLMGADCHIRNAEKLSASKLATNLGKTNMIQAIKELDTSTSSAKQSPVGSPTDGNNEYMKRYKTVDLSKLEEEDFQSSIRARKKRHRRSMPDIHKTLRRNMKDAKVRFQDQTTEQ